MTLRLPINKQFNSLEYKKFTEIDQKHLKSASVAYICVFLINICVIKGYFVNRGTYKKPCLVLLLKRLAAQHLAFEQRHEGATKVSMLLQDWSRDFARLPAQGAGSTRICINRARVVGRIIRNPCFTTLLTLTATAILLCPVAVIADGFYLRAGVGLDRPEETRFTDKDCRSVAPAALYGCRGCPKQGIVGNG